MTRSQLKKLVKKWYQRHHFVPRWDGEKPKPNYSRKEKDILQERSLPFPSLKELELTYFRHGIRIKKERPILFPKI